MNKRQKEVIQLSLEDEKAILEALERNYTAALADIKRNIRELQSNPLTQSKAYQLEFQRQLEMQLTGILDNLQGKNFTSIADYLNTCYNNGFIGTMYDLQGQGVPLVFPIDQNQVLKAVMKTGDDIKLANKLGVSTKELKKQVLAELQRGFATSLSYADIARNISNHGQANMGRAKTIARTEGHRVQNEAKMNALHKAKSKGADVVKQWDSTLDGLTRETHQQLDGQIREIDEPFEVGGKKAMSPGAFGDPSEDCNCRCAMLQRARWAVERVDEETGEVTLGDTTYQKWNNETGGLIECSSYSDFKEKYLKTSEHLQKPKNSGKIKKGSFAEVETSTSKTLKNMGVDYNPVEEQADELSVDEIIRLVSGGDMTSGSCASVALAYAGQRQGWNVLDFRDGSSREFFSGKMNKVKMFQDLGVPSIVSDSAKSNLVNGKRILEQLNEGTEYYLSVGRHAAIVRNNGGVLQYLELQSSNPDGNGWKNFGDVSETLRYRFGCSTSSRYFPTAYATDISQLTGDDFRTILGYINTDVTHQRKGAAGYAK